MADNHSSDGERWFHWYVDKIENHSIFKAALEGVSYCCPCCHFSTLDERGGYDICPVCFWEDDGQDDADADTVRGGPNRSLSLTVARKNDIKFEACE